MPEDALKSGDLEKDPSLETLVPKRKEYSRDEINELFPNNRLDEVEERLRSDEFKALRDLQKELGIEIHLEGGTVRDCLLGESSNDLDFVVRFPQEGADPDACIQKFESFFGAKVVEIEKNQNGKEKAKVRGEYGYLSLTGSRFGVYKFVPKETGEIHDIAFPRVERVFEGVTGCSRDIPTQCDPTIPFIDDVIRRDFTVNCLALEFTPDPEDVQGFTLVDYVGGVDDLQNRILRAVGNPEDRLNESLDRVFRAIRFSSTKGLTMTSDLEQAIIDVVNGDPTDPNTRALERKLSDGRPVVSMETAAKNLSKSLKKAPIETLELLERTGLMHDIFPEWTTGEPPQDLPGSTPDFAKQALHEARKDPKAQEEIRMARQASYGLAKECIQQHVSRYPDATIDEIMFLLSIDLGRLPQFNEEGSSYPHSSFRDLSAKEMTTIVRRASLLSMPKDSPYRVHEDVIKDWISKYSEAVSLFTTSIEPEKISGTDLSRFQYLFPQFSKDPFLRVLNTRMEISPRSTTARTEFPKLLEKVRNVEQILLSDENGFDGLISGGDIVDCAFVKGRTVGILLDDAHKEYDKVLAKANGDLSIDLAKRRIYTNIIKNPETRKYWRMEVAPFVAALGASDYSEEEVTRSILRFMERQFCMRYLGASPEEVALKESAEYAESPSSLSFLLEQRENGRSEGRIPEFGQLLADSLVNDPENLLKYLSSELLNKRSYIRLLFPEFLEMAKTEQSAKYHSEGDVWTHTALLFRNRPPKNIELALAYLFHDIGKPSVTRHEDGRITHFGHEEESVDIYWDMVSRLDLENTSIDYEEVARLIANHGVLYQDGKKDALFVRSYFPNGTSDNLYELIKADSLASVAGEDYTRDDTPLFEIIETWGPLVALENEKVPGLFDVLITSKDMKELLGDPPQRRSVVGLYEVYLDNLSRLVASDPDTDVSGILTSENLLGMYLQSDINHTKMYVKKIFLPGRVVIDRYGLRGRDIGLLQARVGEAIYNGVEVDSDVIRGYVRDLS